MKKCLALLLAFSIFLSGCNLTTTDTTVKEPSSQTTTSTVLVESAKPNEQNTFPEQNDPINPADIPSTEQVNEYQAETPVSNELGDPDVLNYVEETIYTTLVDKLNDAGYFVEDISTAYISQEYLDELKYNSQPNVFFGYTLAELDEQFQGTRYVFTLGDNGETVVQPFEKYDDTYDQILTNVAVGTGVILVSVTVAVITPEVGAPAVIKVIFAGAAKSGTAFALSSSVIGGISAGIITKITTDADWPEVIKASALEGSKELKLGAIIGTVTGGAGEIVSLGIKTLNGLPITEAAEIQLESKYPLSIIKRIHSKEEYEVYKNAGLYVEKADGDTYMLRKIDWDAVVDKIDGRTNSQRVDDGLAPLDPFGKPYELHHVGQMNDSPIAVLTYQEHKGNYKILHKNTGSERSKVSRNSNETDKKWETIKKLTS